MYLKKEKENAGRDSKLYNPVENYISSAGQ